MASSRLFLFLLLGRGLFFLLFFRRFALLLLRRRCFFFCFGLFFFRPFLFLLLLGLLRHRSGDLGSSLLHNVEISPGRRTIGKEQEPFLNLILHLLSVYVRRTCREAINPARQRAFIGQIPRDPPFV